MHRVILLFIILCFGCSLQAAPSPTPWQAAQNLQIPPGAPTELVQYRADGILMNNEILALGLSGDDLCGEVHIYLLNDDGSTTADTANWVLKPEVIGSCQEITFPQIFGSNITAADDLLIITENNSTDRGGLVHVYEAIRSVGKIHDWQLLQTLEGKDFGVTVFGSDSMIIDGQLLISGFKFRARFSRPLFIFSRVGDHFVLANQLTDVEAPTVVNVVPSYGLAGDQIIVDIAGGPLQFYNFDSKQHSLTLAQEMDLGFGQMFDFDASGDYLIGHYFEFSFINVAQRRLAIFKRVNDDQWRFVQKIEAPGGSIFPGRGLSSSALEGSDLIVNWLDITFGGECNSSCTLSMHYRLGNDGLFHLLQDIELNQSNDRRNQITEVLSNGRQLAMLYETEQNREINVQFFSRDKGTHFLINRGITGSWWFGPQRSGQGLFLEVLGPVEKPRVLIHWDTHDNNGNQMWLRGVGQLDFDRVVIDLKRSMGGRFGPDFDPATLQRDAWGQAELIFNDCDNGILHYTSNEFGNGELPLIRSTRIDGLACGDGLASAAARRWTGSWSDPTHNGEGFMLQVAESRSGPVMTAIWNTYRPDGQQLWLYADEPIELSDNVFSPAAVTQTSGLTFDTETGNNERIRSVWGTYLMRRNSCSDIQLSYNSSLPAFGSGDQNLQRITTPLGLACSE